MAAATSLTPHDTTTLSLLFDPESSPSQATAPVSTSLPADPHYPAHLLPSLRALELSAIRLTQTSPADALPLLDELLQEYPSYASGYNNRAQLRRLLSHPVSDVVADLERSISLASPSGSLQEISEPQAKVLQLAWTQLGIVLLSQSRGEGEEEQQPDEGAVNAFKQAAWFGGDLARAMCVKLNPVARLCGSIVKEAMRKEMVVG